MKIKSLQLRNFKRFTDLTLQGIPDDAKLVLLIGSNGSGKSSIFDALEVLNRYKVSNFSDDDKYYSKSPKPFRITADFGNGFLLDPSVKIHTENPVKMVGTSFYGRTSFRQIPKLTRKQLGSNFNILSDSDRPIYFIDRDERFENDLEHLFGQLLREFFKPEEDASAIKETLMAPINEAFDRIFSKDNGTRLQLLELIPPIEGKVAEINFRKGSSIFHYNQLSAGEKEIFTILINLVARKGYLNGILFFDEIDLHLNTKLQYGFLKELIEHWLPDTCQFWTASHSLGFIEYATDYENGCVLDLDDLDFDKPQVIFPKPKDSFEVFEIAVSKAFIDKAVQGRKIVFSENTNTPSYNDLNIENTLFFVALDKNDVFYKAKNHKQFGIVDRDYLSDEELLQIKREYPFLFILPYYSFENLLYHPDNLGEYYRISKKPFDRHNYIQKLTNLKNLERDYLSAGIISARSGYPYFKENDNAKRLRKFKEDFRSIIDLLRSDEFETYYKVFPAKDYGRDFEERKNIPHTELAKTEWFKQKIEATVK